jgi:hypothetical protein
MAPSRLDRAYLKLCLAIIRQAAREARNPTHRHHDSAVEFFRGSDTYYRLYLDYIESSLTEFNAHGRILPPGVRKPRRQP